MTVIFLRPPDGEKSPSWIIFRSLHDLRDLTDSLQLILADTIDIRVGVVGESFLGGAIMGAGLSGSHYLDCCRILMDSLGWNVQQFGDTLEVIYHNGIFSELRAFPSTRRGYFLIQADQHGEICSWAYVPETRWTRLRSIECEVEFGGSVWWAIRNSAIPPDLTPSGMIVTSRDSSRVWAYVADLQHEMTDRILSYDIDFFYDVQPGDHFWLLVEEEHFPDSRETRFRRILAVKYLFNYGGLVEAFPFFHSPSDSTDTDGVLERIRVLDFYHRDGASLRTMFLKMPVPFGRISSPYSDSRLHPVLGYTRAHRGVDYAAPMGTEIFAVGDGVITMRQYNGGYGHYVRIRHANSYVTGYGHLSEYASSQQVGSYVRQGEVIGYVGSTGLSTGPHVHFEMKKSGSFVNPSTEILPPVDPLAGEELERFSVQCNSLESIWLQLSGDVLPVSEEIMIASEQSE